MSANIPRLPSDPEIPFTAGVAQEITERLTRLEASMQLVKTLATLLLGGTPDGAAELWRKWEEVEAAAAAGIAPEFEWLKAAYRRARERDLRKPDA